MGLDFSGKQSRFIIRKVDNNAYGKNFYKE
jgi:hypothetical protein